MKKMFLLMGSLLSVVLGQSQVGINIENPQGLFHIDAGVIGNTSDDIVVTANGNVGIGTSTPTAKLDIRTGGTSAGIRIIDGTESVGKVLTSDMNGFASWEQPGFSSFAAIQYEENTIDVKSIFLPDGTSNGTRCYDLGISITFPSYGTYSLVIGAFLSLSDHAGGIPLESNLSLPALQILPRNDDPPFNWGDSNPDNKFSGSYEIFGVNRSFTDKIVKAREFRFTFSQNIIVTAETGLTAYIILFIESPVDQKVFFCLGNGRPNGLSQTVGGSFVRIN